MDSHHSFRRFCQGLVGALRRGAWGVILASLALSALSAYYTYRHLAFRTSRSDLVAADQRLVQLAEKVTREFGSRDDFVVVVENGHPSRTKAFAEALARKLKAYPQEFPEVFYRLSPESFRRWALWYLEPEQLQELRERLERYQPLIHSLAAEPTLVRLFQGLNQELTRNLLGEVFVGFLDQGPSGSRGRELDLLPALLGPLNETLKGTGDRAPAGAAWFFPAMTELEQEGYFLTENDRYLLFLVTPRKDSSAQVFQSLTLLRELVAQVRADFPEVRAGVTGPLALEVDEMQSAMADITLATWLSLGGQLCLLILFLRSLRRTLLQAAVLVAGLSWTFAMATLVVGHLNLLSIVFAPLMLGITIDYGIHWLCRLEEEQAHQGKTTGNALVCTLEGATPGIVVAALAATASFVPLVFTGFKGLAELGLILAFGVILMLLATFVLLPSLLLVTEDFGPPAAGPGCPGRPQAFLRLHWRRPGLVVTAGLLLAVLGAVSLRGVQFDLNPLNLQNQKTESVVWELKLLKDSRYSTAYGSLTAGSLEELKAKTATLKKLSSVSHVESVLSFLPETEAGREAALARLAPLVPELPWPAAPHSPADPHSLTLALQSLRYKLAGILEAHPAAPGVQEAHRLLGEILPRLEALTPEARARLAAFEAAFFADLREKWQWLREAAASGPPGLADLPPEVRERFVSPQGTFLIRVFSSEDIWNPETLARFVADLRRVDPEVTGDPVLLHEFTTAFRNACLWAAGLGLGLILLMLCLVFRSLKLGLLALLPLGVGTGWTLNLMWLLDLPFNQANVLFLPLILGEAIAFGIIILMRWQREASARVITLPASTAKGVVLSALTTTLGFGSLMVSGHQGTFSLGLLATVGSLSVLLASVSVLPAVLRLVAREAALPKLSGAPAEFLKRWLYILAGKEIW